MDPQTIDYLKKARGAGVSETEIKQGLMLSGWSDAQAEAALGLNPNLPTPPPPPSGAKAAPTPMSSQPAPSGPIAVVQNFSTRGLEYIIMFIALWVSSTAIGWVAHSLVNTVFGSPDSFFGESGVVSFASSSILVSLPIFAILFLRLKRGEQVDQNLRHDPSRKRAIQLTLIVTFLIGIFDVITYVYSLLNGSSTGFSVGTSPSPNRWADLVHALITLAIAGGIFAYYWIDLHKKDATEVSK